MENEVYSSNRKWADKFNTKIKSILGINLIRLATDQEDMSEATDMVLPGRISVRIRKYEDIRYSRQIVIRSQVKSGQKTELDKIKEGYGDYMFYGFSNEQETDIEQWIIGDMNALRNYLAQERYAFQTVNNRDGSKGEAYWLCDIKDFVLAHS